MPSLSVASTVTAICSPDENVAPFEGLEKLTLGDDEDEDDEEDDEEDDDVEPPEPITRASVILSQLFDELPRPTILT